MNKTKIVCPQCGAEFAIPATTHVALGVVLGADSNLGTIHPEVVGQHFTRSQREDLRCTDTTCTNRQPINPKNMKAEAKIEALRAAGVNVSNLFSMKGADGKETIARLTDGHLEMLQDNDPIFAAILNGGTVPNSQLFRRWVMAQVFHMLATGNFTGALQKKGYAYQWKMMLDEMEAQAKMWLRSDFENFAQRNRYFNKERIVAIAADYIDRLNDHIRNLPRKLCKRTPYIRLKGKNIFTEDIVTKVIQPLQLTMYRIKDASDPVELHKQLVNFFKLVKKTWIAYDIPMSAVFKDSYKGAGAYFTMRNLILFHGAKFRADNGRFLSQKQSLAVLESKAEEYKTEGWRLFGVMKKLIDDSHISIARKIAEWHK